MDREMPAQQWISSGWLASQLRVKAKSASTCSRAGGTVPCLGSTMSLMPSFKCIAAGKPVGVWIIFSGDNRLTRCEGACVSNAAARLDKGVTKRRGIGLLSIKPVKAGKELSLRLGRAEGRQARGFQDLGRGSKKPPRLGFFKPSQLRCLVIGREVV